MASNLIFIGVLLAICSCAFSQVNNNLNNNNARSRKLIHNIKNALEDNFNNRQNNDNLHHNNNNNNLQNNNNNNRHNNNNHHNTRLYNNYNNNFNNLQNNNNHHHNNNNNNFFNNNNNNLHNNNAAEIGNLAAPYHFGHPVNALPFGNGYLNNHYNYNHDAGLIDGDYVPGVTVAGNGFNPITNVNANFNSNNVNSATSSTNVHESIVPPVYLEGGHGFVNGVDGGIYGGINEFVNKEHPDFINYDGAIPPDHFFHNQHLGVNHVLPPLFT